MKSLDRNPRGETGAHLRNIDPRAKIVAFAGAAVIVVSEPPGGAQAYLYYYLILAGLFLFGRMAPTAVLRRSLPAIPFILTAAVLLPFSRMAESGGAADWGLSLSLFLKAAAALILVSLLVASDSLDRVLGGMRRLGLPDVFGALSSLMFRFAFLVNDERLRTERARLSRTPGRLRVNRFQVYGRQAAMIFLRSWERAQTLHQAMLSRGFTGTYPSAREMTFRLRDAAFAGLCLGLFGAIRILA